MIAIPVKKVKQKDDQRVALSSVPLIEQAANPEQQGKKEKGGVRFICFRVSGSSLWSPSRQLSIGPIPEIQFPSRGLPVP